MTDHKGRGVVREYYGGPSYVGLRYVPYEVHPVNNRS
jgi:hypothetical protein